MTTDTFVDNCPPQNPFQSQRSFSADAVELMRALSAQRKQSGAGSSSPTQVLQSVRELGYRQPAPHELPAALEARRFVKAISSFQKKYKIPHPTCENVLRVLRSIGYHRPIDETSTVLDGLPIDRRRREEDERKKKTERRSSLEPSAQELLQLTEDEHRFLDALKELRQNTDRDFASSEELLSILWRLGYRPTNKDGYPITWLDDEERCSMQIAFTHAVEKRLASDVNSDFLTCRTVMAIVAELGFIKYAPSV